MLDKPPSIPVHCRTGANLEEIAVQARYGCWRNFFIWVWQAYDLDSTWNSAGISDACNVARPFGKLVNSAFLINYALSDDINRQWHSTVDYRTSSWAYSSGYHGDIYYQLTQRNGPADATAQTGRFLAEDRTQLHCLLFDFGSGNGSDSATNRASVMVHESWHHWQHHHRFQTAHPSCGSPSHDCDYYYFHRLSDFDFGELHKYDTNPAHLCFHSPYQMAVEVAADLAEISRPWVPLIVTQAARSSANARLNSQFVNAVGYRVGSPRPF